MSLMSFLAWERAHPLCRYRCACPDTGSGPGRRPSSRPPSRSPWSRFPPQSTPAPLVPAAAAAPGVEDDGADCPVPPSGSTASRAELPDPFLRANGARASTREDWRCRRAEIREPAERHVYGDKPARPDGVTGTVSRTGITVQASHQGRSAGFTAGVELLSGDGPFPAVVVLGGLGADTAAIKNAGAAVVSPDPYALGREGASRSAKQGAFYTLHGSSSPTGLLMARSWGVSRVIDVIEQSDGGVLRADATGVTGCSRFGKGAFVAGALDQRIALTMPIESGSGGTGAFRGIPQESGAQPLSSAYSEQPWLGDAFGSFTGSPANLPADTHQIVGMIAPRGPLIMENPHVDWLGARSGSLAALGGAEVCKALGAGGASATGPTSRTARTARPARSGAPRSSGTSRSSCSTPAAPPGCSGSRPPSPPTSRPGGTGGPRPSPTAAPAGRHGRRHRRGRGQRR